MDMACRISAVDVRQMTVNYNVRKIGKIGIPLFFFFLLFTAVAVDVSVASTIVVSKTSPACTSGDDYFTSIQVAVDKANDGDDIIVCPGTYMENIEVDKSVSIRSDGRAADTVIEAKNIDDNIINITTNNVDISDFTIRNTEANGIYLDAVVGCNLSGNNIYSTQNGIRLFFSDRNQIYLNTANLNNNSGISLEDSNNNLISNNIANSKQCNGIELNLSNNNIIIENNASNNLQCGIFLWESNNNIIRGNRANSNKLRFGITLYSSDSNYIIGNNASCNFYNGISLVFSTNNTIRDNIATSNKYSSGMELHGSWNNDILNNNISYNFETGIRLFDSNGNIIGGNIVKLNVCV